MAAYDWNGSTRTALPSIKDWNNSNLTTIERAYDWNGTNISLIYSKSTTFYPGTTVQLLQANRGNYGSFYSNEGVLAGTTNINGPVVYIAINLTGINTLSISCSGYSTGVSSCAGLWLASPTQWADSYHQKYPYYTIGVGMSSAYYTLAHRCGDGSSIGDVSWNVSAYSGTYYLACAVYLNAIGGTNCTAGVTITSVVGT